MTAQSEMASRAALRRAISRIKATQRRIEKNRRKRLKLARERIKQRMLSSFIQEDLPRLRYLSDVMSKGCGLPVPTLSICGRGTEEVRFTKLLAWFLDSGNPHGLHGLLAEAVFGPEFPIGVSRPSFEKCHSSSEIYLGQTKTRAGGETGNYLDLMIDVQGWKICVEQKILSGEGEDQLKRYRRRLEAVHAPDELLLIYLTPDGRAGVDDRWKPLSYRVLCRRLAEVLQTKALFPTARHNLKSLLWDLLLGPICQTPDWVESLQHQVERVVAAPERRYSDFSRWLAGIGIGQEERKVLLTLTEA